MMICGWEPGDALSATIGGVSAKLWGVCTNCALFPRALQIKNYYWDTSSSSSSPLSLIFRHKIACMHCICILIIMHVYLLLFLLFCFLEFLCFLLSRWWWWWLCDGVMMLMMMMTTTMMLMRMMMMMVTLLTLNIWLLWRLVVRAYPIILPLSSNATVSTTNRFSFQHSDFSSLVAFFCNVEESFEKTIYLDF